MAVPIWDALLRNLTTDGCVLAMTMIITRLEHIFSEQLPGWCHVTNLSNILSRATMHGR